MSTITCRQAQEWLDRVADGVTEGAPEGLAEHCSSCPHCSAEVARRQRLKISLRRAVSAEPVPVGLDTRVRAQLRAGDAKAWWAMPQWQAVTAGLAVVALTAAGWLAVYRPARLQLAAMLHIGRHDHVHCTLERKTPPFGTLQRPLPAAHDAIVPVAQGAMPAGFSLAERHTCRVEGRGFTHLVFSDGARRVSVIVTAKREGERLPAAMLLARMKADGIAVFQDRVDGLQTAAVETPHSLGFVVSDLEEGENLRMMAAVAVAVRSADR